MDARTDIPDIVKMIEKLSKRLRKVEVFSQPVAASVDSFLKLNDTPDDYTGYAGSAIVVTLAEDGLQFGGAGSACVTFTCGGVGWRGIGGTLPKTLIHETAFQLSSYGNDRGEYAVDLQQVHDAVTQVAAAPYSAILGGRENEIHPEADYSFIAGNNNEITHTLAGDPPSTCWIVGSYTGLDTACYGVFVSGVGIDLFEADYGSYLGYSHSIEAAFGCFALIESCTIKGNVNDDPTYCGTVGVYNEIVGDCYYAFSYGEDNYMEGTGTPGETIWISMQFGHSHYMGLGMSSNYMFGQGGCSYRPTYDGFFDGRIVWAGDYPNEFSAGTPWGLGFNQDSWFSQNDKITTWPASWTTSRFEFPILSDSIWYFIIYISGTEEGCANSYSWKIEGVVENDGGTTTILTSTVTNIYRDVVTKEWQAAADDTNDRLIFQFRDTAGPDATPCNIQMSMFTVEVGFD